MITKEALEACEDLELYSTAQEFGLKVDKNKIDRPKIIAMIMEAQAATANAVKVAPDEGSKKKFRIVIGHQEGVDASTHVAVGVNGYAYQIPRETEVVVPEEVLEALNHTIMEMPMQEGGRTVMRSVRRFPVSVLGPA